MKRTVLLAALLVAASACAAPAPSNNATTSNRPPANTSPAPASTPAASLVTEADALAREKQVYDALKAKNYDAFAAMLADDQVYVSGSGVQDKATTLKGISVFAPTEVTLSDVKLLNATKNLYVLNYKAGVKGSVNGKPLPPDFAERDSTAWINRGGKWLVVYHQETMIKEPPPMPTPGGTPPPTVVASPAASPAAAATTATDMEKQVWDALKRGDYEAFAAFLAEDQLEVEPTGVYNKAQSVAGVKQIDFKGATLSDFKETKLDADATLVTYMVKSPAKGFNPAGEHHTTLWVNRGGKWLAVFHQGSEVGK